MQLLVFSPQEDRPCIQQRVPHDNGRGMEMRRVTKRQEVQTARILGTGVDVSWIHRCPDRRSTYQLRAVRMRIREVSELCPAHLVGMHAVKQAVLASTANDVQSGDVSQTA